MEQLRSVFSQAQTLTQQLLDKLSHGIFLSGEDLMRLFGCFNQITAQQKRCLEDLQRQTGISTEKCASIADLEAILEQHLSFTRRMTDARALVDAFLGVVTVDAMFSVELEKHKAPLRALDDAAILSRYENGELEIYRRFLACIESCSMEDTTPLLEPFGFQIAYGLLGGKFALGTAQVPASAEKPEQPVKSEPIIEPQAADEPQTPDEDEAPSEPEVSSEPEASVEVEPETTAEPEAPAEPETSVEVKPKAPAQPEPPTAALRLPESRLGVLKKDISRCKGSSALVSFIRKKSDSYFHGLSFLLELLLQSYAVDEQYCVGAKYARGIEDQMLLALGHMVREGVAARYTLNGDAENALYALTVEGRRIVGNKDFQKRHLNWKYLFSPLASDIPNAGAFLRYQSALRFYQRIVGRGDNMGASLTKYDDFYTSGYTLWEEPHSPLLLFVPLIFCEADDQAQMDALLGGRRRPLPPCRPGRRAARRRVRRSAGGLARDPARHHRLAGLHGRAGQRPVRRRRRQPASA